MPTVKQNFEPTTSELQQLDFSTVLAACVHDMKNSLFLLLQSIETVAAEVKSSQPRRQLADIHYETQRLNTRLMQLLSLYRQNYGHLPLNQEEQYFDELADDLLANNQFYAQQHHIELNIQVVHEGSWFFDRNLVAVLLNDVIINALRYAKEKVMVTIGIDSLSNECVIEVCDDGSGYPQQMLDQYRAGPSHMDIRSGQTGLGLYFAQLIAQAHRQNQREGSIYLTNNSALGGSQFTLRLP